MSLDVSKLQKVVDLANGMKRARCPACAEQGHDKTGVHLRLYPDGRFGCCVHPQDKEHRKRIFAHAGERVTAQRRGIVVKVATVKSSQPLKTRIVAQVVQSSAPDASDASAQIEMALEKGRTVRTGKTKFSDENFETVEESRTLRTGTLYSSNGAEKIDVISSNTLKDFCPPVRNVRAGTSGSLQLPYLKADGTLVIPPNSPERYHWWKKGQRLSVDETIAEIRERCLRTATFDY